MAYRDVLAIESNLPDSWYNLGWLLRRSGQPVAALKAYDEALARNISRARKKSGSILAFYTQMIS
jgi:tetratricopeptide (TPR) repeat protein